MDLLNYKHLKINNLNCSETLKKNIDFFLKNWFSEEKYTQIKTSGSTGIPKILDISKEKMLHSAEMTCNFLQLSPNNTALLCLPIEYISGKMMLVRALYRGLHIVVTTPSVTPLDDLKEKIDFCAMTPLQVENSLDKIHLINKLIIGGASVSESLKVRIREVLPPDSQTKIYETYGMSETLSHIALKQVFPQDETYFTILENIKISQDDRGCLCIEAPKLVDNILVTNDLVEIKNQQQFRFLGRVDNVINSGGAKIFPEELEKIVKKHIPNEVVFLGLPDEKLGNKLVLIVEGKESIDLKNIIFGIHFEKSFHKPKDIIFVNKIPRTSNGKVQRNELRTNLIRK